MKCVWYYAWGYGFRNWPRGYCLAALLWFTGMKERGVHTRCWKPGAGPPSWQAEMQDLPSQPSLFSTLPSYSLSKVRQKPKLSLWAWDFTFYAKASTKQVSWLHLGSILPVCLDGLERAFWSSLPLIVRCTQQSRSWKSHVEAINVKKKARSCLKLCQNPSWEACLRLESGAILWDIIIISAAHQGL